MVGGGDQIYCDALTAEPEMQGQSALLWSSLLCSADTEIAWINEPDREHKLAHPLDHTIVSMVISDQGYTVLMAPQKMAVDRF